MHIPDHPTIVDRLGRWKLATSLAISAMDCRPSHVYGVHGDWGAGKTSFLRMIQYYLGGDCTEVAPTESERTSVIPPQLDDCKQPAVVWFEAWRYQHEAAPVVALLHEIRGQLALWARARNWIKREATVAYDGVSMYTGQLANVVLAQSAGGVAIRSKDGNVTGMFRDAETRYDHANLAERLPSDTIRKHLASAINQLLANPGTALGKIIPKKFQRKEDNPRRLIILVDDLDRCEPQAAFRLLEGIKLYMNLPNCVFIMGMDERAVEEAVAAAIPEELDQDDTETSNSTVRLRAREYLEKVFQEIVRLPRMKSSRPILESYLPAMPAGSPHWEKAKSLVMDTPELLPGIPRKVKLFVRTLYRFMDQCSHCRGESGNRSSGGAEGFDHDLYASLGVILAYTYQFHPDLYRRLESSPEFYSRLFDWCDQGDSNLKAFKGIALPNLRKREMPEDAAPGAEGINLGSTRPPGATDLEFTFPDYSRGNVFRAQGIVVAAGDFDPGMVESMLL